MKRFFYVFPAMAILLLFAIGCSSNQGEPISPSTSIIPDVPVSAVAAENADRTLVGEWTLNFDGSKLNVSERVDRDPMAHMNVKPFISPTFTVVHIDPVTGIVIADVKITNPTGFTGYDVRLIVLTDNFGSRLRNYDDWTTLFDIAGGSQINPFKAFVREGNRMFGPFENHTERCQFWFPPNNPAISMAIDVSLPTNCNEPYAIENFQQETLFNLPGSEAIARVRVLDHQSNVNAVNLYCPVITGLNLIPFTYIRADEWELNIINPALLAEGEYEAAIIATSSNSGALALYDIVKIQVSDESGVPSNPRIVGWWDMFTNCYDVEIIGGLAYVADGVDGFSVVDCGVTKYPDIIGRVDTTDARGLDVEGSYAYVADYGGGLRIIDITEPSEPVIVGSFDSSWNLVDVEVEGDLAYCVAASWGLQIFNVQDRTNPVEVDNVFTSTNAKGVTYSNNYAYIASGAEGLFKINVTDPSNPVNECSIDLTNATDVVATSDGGYAFVSDGSAGVISVDISECPMSIAGSYNTNGSGEGVTVMADRLLVADGAGGLDYLNCADPANLVWYGHYDDANSSVGVAVSGNTVLVAQNTAGILVADISTITAPPVAVGWLGTGYDAQFVDVYGENVYLSAQNQSFVTLDVSDPGDPDVTSYFTIGNYIYDITSRPGLAFCARNSVGMIIIDVGDPSNPSLVPGSSVATSANAQAIAVAGNYAYVGSGAEGLFIINITNINAPFVESVVDTSDARGVSVWDHYAYIADWNAGVKVIDVADPADPDLLGSIDTTQAHEVDSSAFYVYVADSTDGLKIIDVSNPAVPQVVSALSIGGNTAADITVLGDYAYVAGRTGGLYIINIKDKTTPYLYRQVDTNGSANHVVISDNYAYVADDLSGLKIIKLF